MKKALITGADGFIGQQLTKFLASKKISVTALVYKYCDFNNLETYDNVEYIPIELENIKQDINKMPVKCDILFHMAWSGVKAESRNDYSLQIKNINYCIDILELAKELEIKKVIFPGSAGEYATCGEIITGYNTPAPNDGYSAAKAAAHIICNSYANKHNIPFIYVVISSIYGPGRDDDNILSYSIKSLLKGESPAFTKLEQKWNYIYITDLIEALYYVAIKGIPGKTYAIGYEESLPLAQYITKIHSIIDPSIPLQIGALQYKSGIIDHSVMDITQLKKDTGFIPKTTFDEGIKKVIEYFRSLN